MDFKLIDRANWDREEYFNHYFSKVPCTYSMTTKLNITNIINSGKKFYPLIIHLISQVVNNHQEFRMFMNAKKQLGYFTQTNPSYTIFHKQTETFSNIWTEYSADYDTFLKAYRKDLAEFGEINKFFAKPCLKENVFNISVIPWESFDSFNLNLKDSYEYLLPIFTMGKYFTSEGKILLPLSIQVHHAVCDGFHLCRFINELKERIAEVK